MELMTAWQHEGLPPHISGAEFEVWDGSHVARVRRVPSLDWESLWRTDCNHPAMNAYFEPGRIKAWRLAHGASSTGLRDEGSTYLPPKVLTAR